MTVHDILVPQGKLWAVLEQGKPPTFHETEEAANTAAEGLENTKIEEGAAFRLKLPEIGFNMPKAMAENDHMLAQTVMETLRNISAQIMAAAAANAPLVKAALAGDIPPERPEG